VAGSYPADNRGANVSSPAFLGPREAVQGPAEKYKVPVTTGDGFLQPRWENAPRRRQQLQCRLEGQGTYGIMALVRNPSAGPPCSGREANSIPGGALKTDPGRTSSGASLLALSGEAAQS